MKLIGIVGKKRSGKDTIAEYLIANNRFQRYSFADPIKKGVMEMFGFTEAQMWGSAEDKETVDPRWGISPRRMLQLVGTELFQYDIRKHLKDDEFPIGREVWVHKFKLWYQEEKALKVREALTLKQARLSSADPEFNVVIADMRFVHEAKAVREMGGVIWRVERPSLVSVDEHASEMEQNSIVADVTITNDGSLEDLYKKVREGLQMEAIK